MGQLFPGCDYRKPHFQLRMQNNIGARNSQAHPLKALADPMCECNLESCCK